MDLTSCFHAPRISCDLLILHNFVKLIGRTYTMSMQIFIHLRIFVNFVLKLWFFSTNYTLHDFNFIQPQAQLQQLIA